MQKEKETEVTIPDIKSRRKAAQRMLVVPISAFFLENDKIKILIKLFTRDRLEFHEN